MQSDHSSHLPEDAFLDQFLGAMVLESALRNGLIDALVAGHAMPQTRGGAMLVSMLEAAGVLKSGTLTPAFRQVLEMRRDILEQKLKFLRLSALDVLHGLDDLLGNLPAFMAKSETFALFRYDKAKETDQASVAATRAWVDYVTALSKAEAPVLAPHLPLESARRLLEVGGNTGVMARAALDMHPDLQAVILDLPAVCAIGAETGAHPRLSFVAGDARRRPWPLVDGGQPDAILFKSVLHDWPIKDAIAMIDRAIAHLAPGGRIIICERGGFGGGNMPFWMTANLVFAPFYRSPDIYREEYIKQGLGDIAQRDIALDMPFHILSGCKA